MKEPLDRFVDNPDALRIAVGKAIKDAMNLRFVNGVPFTPQERGVISLALRLKRKGYGNVETIRIVSTDTGIGRERVADILSAYEDAMGKETQNDKEKDHTEKA